METKISAPSTVDDLDALWRARESVWRRKLGRLRLGVEPIEEQLARYRRVTWVLTAVPAALGVMFFTLFAVFGYPLVGLVFDAIVLLPIVLGAWGDHALMAFRAQRYSAEASRYLRQRERLFCKSLFLKWEGEPPAEPHPPERSARREARPPEIPPSGTDSNRQ